MTKRVVKKIMVNWRYNPRVTYTQGRLFLAGRLNMFLSDKWLYSRWDWQGFKMAK